MSIDAPRANGGGVIPVLAPVAGSQQAVAVSAVSAQSTAIPEGVYIVGIYSDVRCHIAVGADPTATTNHLPVPADSLVYMRVKPGEKIAGISTTTGTLWIQGLN